MPSVPRPSRLIASLCRPLGAFYDAFEAAWESGSGRRLRGWAILLAFGGTLLWVGVERLFDLPASLRIDKPFAYAIHAAFTLVLMTEVVQLVLSLPRSVATSVGKQFEIFSLILLRQAFEEFSHGGDDLEFQFALHAPAMHMVADVAGAVAVFVLTTVYMRMQTHRRITSDEEDQRSFVLAKKALATALIGVFAYISVRSAIGYAGLAEPIPLFKTFYVVLIFSDVLLVLLAVRYSDTHAVVFRNSGFAVCTLLIRVALTAPPYFNAMLGVVSAGLLLALAAAYRFAVSEPRTPAAPTPGGSPDE